MAGTVNGVHYDYADLTANFDGINSVNIDDVDWGGTREVEPTCDKTGLPDGGEIRKKYKGQWSCTIPLQVFTELNDREGGFYGGEPWQISLQYAKEGQDTHSVEFEGRPTKDNHAEKMEEESKVKVEGIKLSVPIVDGKPMLVMPGSATSPGGRGGGGGPATDPGGFPI